MSDIKLIPLGAPDAAVCEGDFCVIPAVSDVISRLDADEA
ncbi:hypothetical protein CLV46_1606 [Diaminobutyricimonas aerilata]|uniref:Uncharacterized protein n=1 Tax=Diaminobutyricimonas aerilata TaxID=1162967 RepID=A0A2M9CJH2_9MICO|nr:hypothetical protein CLV46_1606 [Diaminobutyricimonas aerilata]